MTLLVSSAVVGCSFDGGVLHGEGDEQMNSGVGVDAAPPAADASVPVEPDAEAQDDGSCMTSPLYVPRPGTGRRYRAVDVVADWPEAQADCEVHGAHLIVIDDAAENAFAFELLGQDQWIGLTDVEVEGEFRWVTGAPLVYANWMTAQPDNLLFVEDYVEMWIGGAWNDLPAGDFNNRYICECDPSWSP